MYARKLEELGEMGWSPNIGSEIKYWPRPNEHVSDAHTVTKPDGSDKSTTCDKTPLEEVLHKIKENGLSALSFNELYVLQTAAKDAAANLFYKRSEIPVVNSGMDRGNLTKRLISLENDVIGKQKHAQQEVSDLQMGMQLEQRRLDEMRLIFEREKQRNAVLSDKIDKHYNTIHNLLAEREMLRQTTASSQRTLHSLVVEMEKEREYVDMLEEQLENEKRTVAYLQNFLLIEQEYAKKKQKKTLQSLEATRQKLDKAIRREAKLKMKLRQYCVDFQQPSNYQPEAEIVCYSQQNPPCYYEEPAEKEFER